MATKPAAKKSAAKPTAEVKVREVDPQGRRVKTEGEPRLARYSENKPTKLQQDFADWLKENTGYDVDVQSVSLATSLRGEFQKSPENQQSLQERREAAEQAKIDRDKRIAERKEAAAKEAAKPKVAKVAKPKAEVAEDGEEAPAKPKARKPVAKPAVAAKAAAEAKPKRRRAPAKAAALDEEI